MVMRRWDDADAGRPRGRAVSLANSDCRGRPLRRSPHAEMLALMKTPLRHILAAAALLLGACASSSTSPFDDIAAMQQRIDARGLGFGLARVPGHDAVVFQLRFSASEADETAAPADPLAAAQAAAPPGCTVETIIPAQDGLSFRADYAC